MAFKPVVKEKEINGKIYKAQFNGVSAMLDAVNEAGDDSKKLVEYLFANVLVEPKIEDIDEYFGTDVELMNKVVDFAGAVMRADKEYFPKSDKSGTAAKGSK